MQKQKYLSINGKSTAFGYPDSEILEVSLTQLVTSTPTLKLRCTKYPVSSNQNPVSRIFCYLFDGCTNTARDLVFVSPV